MVCALSFSSDPGFLSKPCLMHACSYGTTGSCCTDKLRDLSSASDYRGDRNNELRGGGAANAYTTIFGAEYGHRGDWVVHWRIMLKRIRNS
jgi:hypothetical protein